MITCHVSRYIVYYVPHHMLEHFQPPSLEVGVPTWKLGYVPTSIGSSCLMSHINGVTHWEGVGCTVFEDSSICIT